MPVCWHFGDGATGMAGGALVRPGWRSRSAALRLRLGPFEARRRRRSRAPQPRDWAASVPPPAMACLVGDNLGPGRPDQVSLIFGKKVNRRSPGRFRTRVCAPVVLEGQSGPAPRIGDPRVQPLLSVLVVFRLLPDGFSKRNLRARLAPLPGLEPGAMTAQDDLRPAATPPPRDRRARPAQTGTG
ncbi:MAG: hypothetical protein WAV54_02180 [Acidimicrobiales bacterium]